MSVDNIMDLSALDNLSEKEREYALKILHELAVTGESKEYNELKYADYSEIPVNIKTFLTDDHYLGQAWKDATGKLKLYDFWMDRLNELFPTNVDTAYNTLLESGARGIGKSEVACGCVGAYLLYRVLCMKNPLEFFHLKQTEKICFAFMNIKLALAEDIAISKFQKTLQMSPWFMKHGKMTSYHGKPYWIPPEPVQIIIGSQPDDVIGLPIFFAFFDEISFIRNQDIDKQKARAKDLIDTAIGGMMTRFVHGGKNPTMLVVASSKRSEQSFMEEYIKTLSKTQGNTTMVVDKPVWEVKPKGTYSDETFYIGLGNKFLESIVIPDEDYDKLELYKARGYQIIEAPIDFKSKFLEDIDRNLCDFAGISSSSSNKYMSGRIVSDAINPEFKNPFPDILEIGNGQEDTAQYYNFFDLAKIPKELLYKPLYVHLDMSVTGDMTGIAGVWIVGKKVSTDDQPAKDLSFRLAFSVSIKAPKGHQVSFEKNRKFIRWLKETGFNVKGITSDTYQSYDLQQQLSAEGFDCSMLSVDRVTDGVCQPYQYLRSAIYEKRFTMYKSNRLFDEFVDIERNNNTGKIDHSPNCFTGDTKIRLVDGRSVSIEELLREHITGKQNYVYSINHTENKIEPKVIKNVWKTKDVTKLLRITLDNGEVIKCTPEHPFMLRNGSYILAKDIIPHDSLMPLYTKVSEKGLPGYRLFYDPFEDKWHYEHRFFAQEVDDTKFLVHHKNCNKLDNTPPNLIWMSKEKHILVHSNNGTGAFSQEANDKRSSGVKQWHENNKDTDKYKLRNMRLRDSNRANYPASKAAKHREYIKDIESYFNINYSELTTSERAHCASMWLRHTNPDYTEHHKKMLTEKLAKGVYTNAKNDLNKCNEKSKMLREMFPELDKSKFVELFGFEYDSLASTQKPVWTNRYRQKLYELLNHKVVAVETINVPLTPVYDIEVEDNHNFALDAGVFVHNCHKDALDAVCGATFNASKHAEEYAFDHAESLELTTSVNKEGIDNNSAQQISVDFEMEMQKLLDPVQASVANENKPIKNDTQNLMDFGFGKAQPVSFISDGIIVW